MCIRDRIDTSAEVQQLATLYFHICIWGAPATLGLYGFSGWFIGMQNSRFPMFIAITQNIVNIAASLLFVFVFGMKVEGVALGTLIAQYAGLFMAYLLWLRYYRSLRKYISWKKLFTHNAMKRLFQVNRDIFLRTLCLVAVTVFFTSTGAAYGDVVLAVNKMDLVDFSKEVFDKIVADYKAFIDPLGVPDVNCIPLSALDGDNVVEKSDRTPWYSGPSLLEFLETVHIGNDHNLKDFRYPVQYVLRPNLDFRGFCGKVASGIIRKGDEVMALPSGKKSHIKSIVTYDGELDYAFSPMSVTLTLEDEIDVSRGEMLVHPDNMPMIGRNFEAMLVWMDEEKMNMDKAFFLKQTTNTSRTRVDSIKYKVDINTMEHLSVENGRLKKEDVPMQLNQIARVVLTSSKELFFDPYTKNKATGAFILIDPITNNTSAVGMIIDQVADKDMHNTMELPVLDLPKLGIAPEHYEAIEKAVKELSRQGIAIEIRK